MKNEHDLPPSRRIIDLGLSNFPSKAEPGFNKMGFRTQCFFNYQWNRIPACCIKLFSPKVRERKIFPPPKGQCFNHVAVSSWCLFYSRHIWNERENSCLESDLQYGFLRSFFTFTAYLLCNRKMWCCMSHSTLVMWAVKVKKKLVNLFICLNSQTAMK